MSKIIRVLMEPLAKYFAQKDVMEIVAVNSGFVGLERDVTGWEEVKDDAIDLEYWSRLCNVTANANGVMFDEVSQPRLSAVLPGGHRIEVMQGNNVDSKLSVTIRVKRNIKWELADFGLDVDTINWLIKLIRSGVNLVISAGTSGGKTSFLNALVQYINGAKAEKNIRTITVEDAREIDLDDPRFSPQYVVSRNENDATIGYNEIIDHLVRSNPTYIILGEISVKNAYHSIRMLNTGHKGFLCTIHANSPIDALNKAFPQNTRMAGIDSNEVGEWLHDLIDVVVQLGSTKDGKRVSEIYLPKTRESKKFIDSRNARNSLKLGKTSTSKVSNERKYKN
jgi:Flp pilus assembly CpaF family ATPase